MSLSEEDVGLLTIAEAATQFQVNPVTIRSWIRRDQLAAVWLQGRLHVVEAAFYETEHLMRHARKGRKRADR
jgi:transposase-like protein